jgi:hypothetical protein
MEKKNKNKQLCQTNSGEKLGDMLVKSWENQSWGKKRTAVNHEKLQNREIM